MESTQPLSTALNRLSGRYRLGLLVGRGATAEVFRAYDEVLQRDVAIKIFHREALTVSDDVRQRSEIEILAGFNHPGLVTVFDAGNDDSAPGDPRSYLVMELIEGSTLSSVLAHGPMSASEVASMAARLASALAYVHARGVVHRDVKPANVMLVDGGRHDNGVTVKLTDFGIARHVDSTRLTSIGSVIGTASYLSPEQVTGSDITAASDMYSLGLVLIECLTGNRAFPGNGVEAALARLHRDPPCPDRFGAEWRQVLSALTARDPRSRPTAAQAALVFGELAGSSDALEHEVDTEPLGPLPGITWRLPAAHAAVRGGSVHERFRFGKRGLFALAGSLLVAVIGALVAVSIHGGSRQPATPPGSPLGVPSAARSSTSSNSPTPVVATSAPSVAQPTLNVPVPATAANSVASAATVAVTVSSPAPAKSKPGKGKGKG